MRKMEIAMALACQVDKYHMQLRDGQKTIGAAGLVGCFGGKVEPDEREDKRKTVSRELGQETNLVYGPGNFKFLQSVEVVSDHQLEPVEVHASVFEILLPLDVDVEAQEGQLVTWSKNEVLENIDQLTPATKKFFEEHFA